LGRSLDCRRDLVRNPRRRAFSFRALLDWHFWANFALVLATAVVIPAGVIGVASLMESARRPLKAAKRYWRNRQQRKLAIDQPVTMKTISSILVVSPLCQRMQIEPPSCNSRIS